VAAFLRRELSKARRDTQEVVQLNVFLRAKHNWKFDIIGIVANPDPYVSGPPGSGSLSQRRIRIRPRILLSSCKNSKKNLDSYCFVTTFMTFFSLKSDVNVPSKKY
jgi:hypothetical protein